VSPDQIVGTAMIIISALALIIIPLTDNRKRY
jgi:hypothetical protein